VWDPNFAVGLLSSSRWGLGEPETHGNRGAALLGNFERTFSVEHQIDFA